MKYKNHIVASISALIVIILSIVFWFIINRFQIINLIFNKLIKILTPIIYGAILAFLFTPLCNKIQAFLKKLLLKSKLNEKKANKIAKFLSILLCFKLLVLIFFTFLILIIPQLISSLSGIIRSLPGDFSKLANRVYLFLSDYPQLGAYVNEKFLDFAAEDSLISKTILPNLNKYISDLSFALISFFKHIFNVLIGVIVMLYLLSIKSTLSAQAKRIIYANFPIKLANIIVEETRYIKKVFSQFIVGKIIDSIIVACINYVFMSLFRMEYALLISIVIGATNIIPFFGPFIGAIPSIVILLINSPMSALQFSVWILVLQQIDGNIIGPKILGQTTGLPSFFILFSILLFGGMFGIVGMIIGVPSFAIIYRFLARQSEYRLSKKNLKTKTKDYLNLSYIDEETKEYKMYKSL